jgi:chromosome segregation ATPase
MGRTILQLQQEADQQLELEMETQMTLEHFLGQMVSLKNAFAMLSDVVMHEVDAARSEARRRVDSCDARIESQRVTADNLIHEYGQLTNRVSAVESKQDRILQELVALRTQGDQTAAWLTTVAEQVSVVKEQMSETTNTQIEHNAGVVKECSQLKLHWEQQSTKIVGRINECGAEVTKQRADLTAATEQRMDDLELLEKALSTLQAQQVRLRANVDEAVIPLQTESASLRSKADQLDAGLSTVKVDAVETRHELESVERDARHRFDNVSRVFKVFAEALNVQTPPSVANNFKD